MAGTQPSTSFGFNSHQAIASHSSVLYNQRMAILFFMLDMKAVQMNINHNVSDMLEVKGYLVQIYKNIRSLIRNNPTMRATLNLDTDDEGIYVTDVGLGIVENLIKYCEVNEYTAKRIYIIIQELNNIEVLLKDILQYYHYFIRPDFRQKPGMSVATEKYKEIADKKSIEELRELVGKNHHIDFNNLGSKRVDLIEQRDEEEYDEEDDYDDDDDEEELEVEVRQEDSTEVI